LRENRTPFTKHRSGRRSPESIEVGHRCFQRPNPESLNLID
jgi:hypothetical protein